jgi:hypothetical protein
MNTHLILQASSAEGDASVASRITVVPGKKLGPIGVGREGQWQIPGVAALACYLLFDGETLFVAAVSSDVRLDNRPVGRDWLPVPIPATIRLTGAEISVTPKALTSAPPAAAPLPSTIIERTPLPPQSRWDEPTVVPQRSDDTTQPFDPARTLPTGEVAAPLRHDEVTVIDAKRVDALPPQPPANQADFAVTVYEPRPSPARSEPTQVGSNGVVFRAFGAATPKDPETQKADRKRAVKAAFYGVVALVAAAAVFEIVGGPSLVGHGAPAPAARPGGPPAAGSAAPAMPKASASTSVGAPPRPSASVAAAPAASSAAKVVPAPPRASAIAAAAVKTPPAAAPASSVRVAAGKGAKPAERPLVERALEAAATGSYADASLLYEELASQTPSQPAYAAAARILAERAQRGPHP